MVMALRIATVQLFTESLSILLAREVGDLSTVAELFKESTRLITIESTQYELEDPSCRPSAHSSRRGSPSIMKCNLDFCKDFARHGLPGRWRRQVPRDW